MAKVYGFLRFADSRNDDVQSRAILKASQEISRLTGIHLENVCEECYGLVINPEHGLYGKVGVYFGLNWPLVEYRFGKDRVYFPPFSPEIFAARNIICILEERAKLIEGGQNSNFFD